MTPNSGLMTKLRQGLVLRRRAAKAEACYAKTIVLE
jgi:hypothetical protein